MARLTWDPSELYRRLDRAFVQSVVATTRAAISFAPMERGSLRRSITFRILGPFHAIVGVLRGPASRYAGVQESGSGLHGPHRRAYPIEPRRRRALWWPGAAHPVRRVRAHPGVRGRHYLSRAVAEVFFPRFARAARRALGL